jgi:hypothetical protein
MFVNTGMYWLGALALTVGTVIGISGLPQSAAAQQVEAAAVAPLVGGRGTTFSFSASGFLGDADEGDDDDHNDAELVVYYVTTPEGRMITEEAKENDDGARERLEVRAGRDGSAAWSWMAPSDAALGSYLMTARGEQSGVERQVAFELKSSVPAISPASGEATVSPQSGRAGGTFTFVATGFRGNLDGDDDSHGERVAYWVILPDGRVIDQELNEDDEDEPTPYIARTDEDGRAQWEWTAPVDAPAGSYTLVARGLSSGLEHSIVFALR